MRNIPGAAHAAPSNISGPTPAATPLVTTQPTQFPHLHLGYYDRFRAVFQEGGYRHLGDYEVPGARHCPVSLDAPTMLRFLASPSGHITASYWHLLPRIGRRIRTLAADLASLQLDAPREFIGGLGLRHVVHLQTEFDDGSFLLTTNAPADPADPAEPPSIEICSHPPGTTPSLLLKAHRKRVSEIIRSGSGRTPVPVRSEDDLLRMQSRLHAARAHQGAARAPARAGRPPLHGHPTRRAA